MAVFVDWAAAVQPEERAAVHAAAVTKVTPFDPDDASLRNASFEDFLGMLAWDLEVKPTLLRVALVHWLSGWAARRAHTVLVLQDLVPVWDGSHQFLVYVGLTPQKWHSELNAQKTLGALTFPGAPAALWLGERRIAALGAAALGGGGGAGAVGMGDGEAPWVAGMDEPEMPVADQAALVDRLACVPDASSGFMAGMLTKLANALNLTSKARVLTLLGVIQDSIVLKSGVTVLIRACPESQRANLFSQIGLMVAKVESKYGAAVDGALVTDSFTKAAPTLTALALKPGTNWPDIGAAILTQGGLAQAHHNTACPRPRRQSGNPQGIGGGPRYDQGQGV